MVDAVESMDIMKRMAEFDRQYTNSPMFKVFWQYMSMILEKMMFIRRFTRLTGPPTYKPLRYLPKYFFFHDRLNYSWIIPLYLAGMKSLKSTDPDINAKFQNGNWVVNKNSKVSFCGLGDDNAPGHANRSMKVSGGLVSITQNPSARAKVFLITPELARLIEQAEEIAGVSIKIQD